MTAFAEPLGHYFLSLVVCVILMALHSHPEVTVTAVSIARRAAALAFYTKGPKDVCIELAHSTCP